MSDAVLIACITAVPTTITAIGAIIKTNNTIRKELDEVKDMLTNHIKKDDDDKAEQWRVRILRFDDELCDLIRPYPNEANFQQAMSDRDKYRRYIDEHEDFHNGIGEAAMANIEKMYQHCRLHGKFGKPKETE